MKGLSLPVSAALLLNVGPDPYASEDRLEGIAAYKTYDRTGGYDLISVNPPKNRSVRIQVKSRWATDYDKGYPFGDSYGSDFAVLAELNRGYSWSARGGKKDPVLYVVPTLLCRKFRRRSSGWGKVFLTDIPDVERYRFNWGLIKQALGMRVGKSHAQ